MAGQPTRARLDENGTEEDERLLAPSPTGRSRAAARVVIAAFVGLQLWLPLQYYLSDDPYDERFSWRMFSTVRVARCQSQAWERAEANATPTPVRLSGARDRAGQPVYGVIHNAWRTLIQRNRVAVIEAYLEHRCAVSPIAEAAIENHCIQASGHRLPPLKWHRNCASGDSSAPSEASLAAVRAASRPRTR